MGTPSASYLGSCQGRKEGRQGWRLRIFPQIRAELWNHSRRLGRYVVSGERAGRGERPAQVFLKSARICGTLGGDLHYTSSQGGATGGWRSGARRFGHPNGPATKRTQVHVIRRLPPPSRRWRHPRLGDRGDPREMLRDTLHWTGSRTGCNPFRINGLHRGLGLFRRESSRRMVRSDGSDSAKRTQSPVAGGGRRVGFVSQNVSRFLAASPSRRRRHPGRPVRARGRTRPS
jgi:hypothetical protein